jgi:hypothetical protein
MRILLMRIILGLDVTRSEMSWDEFNALFQSALALAEELLLGQQQATRRIISDVRKASPKTSQVGKEWAVALLLDVSLFLVARRCRHPGIRRRALALLEHYFSLTLGMDTAIFIGMTKAIIAVEEVAWASFPEGKRDELAAPAPCGCARGVFICNGHRVIKTAVAYPSEGMANLLVVTGDDEQHGRPGRRIPLAYGKYTGENWASHDASRAPGKT